MGSSPKTRVGRPPVKVQLKPKSTKHPWDQVRDHYVTAETTLTIKELAQVYDISEGVIRTKASQDRWNYLRAEYWALNQKALQEARRKTLVKEALGFDDMSLKAAKLGQTLIVGRLGQIAALFQAQNISFEQALDKARRGIPLAPHEMRSGVNYKELVELANALDRFQGVGRKALGTDMERIDLSIAYATDENYIAVSEELGKPNLDRMTATIEAMRRAGLSHLLEEQLSLPSAEGEGSDEENPGSQEEDNVVEGEIVS